MSTESDTQRRKRSQYENEIAISPLKVEFSGTPLNLQSRQKLIRTHRYGPIKIELTDELREFITKQSSQIDDMLKRTQSATQQLKKYSIIDDLEKKLDTLEKQNQIQESSVAKDILLLQKQNDQLYRSFEIEMKIRGKKEYQRNSMEQSLQLKLYKRVKAIRNREKLAAKTNEEEMQKIASWFYKDANVKELLQQSQQTIGRSKYRYGLYNYYSMCETRSDVQVVYVDLSETVYRPYCDRYVHNKKLLLQIIKTLSSLNCSVTISRNDVYNYKELENAFKLVKLDFPELFFYCDVPKLTIELVYGTKIGHFSITNILPDYCTPNYVLFCLKYLDEISKYLYHKLDDFCQERHKTVLTTLQKQVLIYEFVTTLGIQLHETDYFQKIYYKENTLETNSNTTSSKINVTKPTFNQCETQYFAESDTNTPSFNLETSKYLLANSSANYSNIADPYAIYIDVKDTNFIVNNANNVVGAFVCKNATATGICHAFKYLCDKHGIKCQIVSGTVMQPKTGYFQTSYSINHSWCILSDFVQYQNSLIEQKYFADPAGDLGNNFYKFKYFKLGAAQCALTRKVHEVIKGSCNDVAADCFSRRQICQAMK